MYRFLTIISLFGITLNAVAASVTASEKPAAEVFILQEGYDRYPHVGASVTLIKSQGINIVADPGMSNNIEEILRN